MYKVLGIMVLGVIGILAIAYLPITATLGFVYLMGKVVQCVIREL